MTSSLNYKIKKNNRVMYRVKWNDKLVKLKIYKISPELAYNSIQKNSDNIWQSKCLVNVFFLRVREEQSVDSETTFKQIQNPA